MKESIATKILIRDLPVGTLDKLRKMADESFRSLEGEARYALKSYAEKNKDITSEQQPKVAVKVDLHADETPDVESLRLAEKHLHTVIHSMSRKLSLGSKAVSLDDLTLRNEELADIERQLVLLGKYPTQRQDK